MSSYAMMRRIFQDYLGSYIPFLIIAFLFMAVSSGATAGIAALMKPILDDVLNAKKEHLIIPVSLLVAAIFVTRGAATYVHTIVMNKIGQSVVADIQSNLFKSFMRQDMAFFHANTSGELISRVTNDVGIMRVTVTSVLTGFGKSALTLIFLIGVMFMRDWKLTLAAFVVFPLLSIFVIYIGKRLRKVSKKIQAEMGTLSDILSQVFRGMRIVRAYGMEEGEVKHVRGAIDKVRDLNIKEVRLSTLSTPVNETLVGILFGAIIAYGGYEVLAGNTTSGQLASFLAAFSLAYEPAKKLARLNNTLQKGLGAAERVYDMLDMQETIFDSEKNHRLETRTASIAFDNVTFSYDSDDRAKALNAISFTAEAGKVTALVGASGGGKSTVMNLIPRFYDVTGGHVRINGHDVRDLNIGSLRQHIALVSQDITIFNISVLENIRYGAPDATLEDVQAAAQAAAAHDFVIEMAQGYNTVLGENGLKLSGGQKQRISIARAILRDAPILLLDEATSALDNESEKAVQKALKALEKGRTTIVIAHRLTTVQSADQILVLDHGHIVERGAHHDLIAQDGVYASMYEKGLS